jgi:flagellar biosynthesis/type III secretory pathway M-ring protein FliF/YscJ
MTDPQPSTIVEGATTGDIDDEIPTAARSAEDRKAAAALSSLDAHGDDESKSAKDVDQEAVRKAMDRLAGSGGSNGTRAKKEDEKKTVKKNVKVDPSDVSLLVRLSRLFIVCLF